MTYDLRSTPEARRRRSPQESKGRAISTAKRRTVRYLPSYGLDFHATQMANLKLKPVPVAGPIAVFDAYGDLLEAADAKT